MTTTDEDEEWERTEAALKSLSIESKSKPITILPSNRCNPAQSIPISPYDYSAPIYSNTNNSPASFYVPNVIQVSPLPDDQIDSALVSAISNPRERMVLFHIENSILDFVKSNEKSMDFQPGYNSFRRLLAYRVGQRFGLSHSTTDTNAENGERSITLFKTKETVIPKVLLIDLNIPADDNFNDDIDYVNPFQPSNPVSLDSLIPAATTPSSSTAPKKFMLMKRSVLKQPSESAKVAAVKQQQSEEDKEKAYNEARARIFGEDASAAAESPIAAVEQSTLPSHSPVASSNSNVEKGEVKSTAAVKATSTSAAKDAAPNKPAATGSTSSKSQSSTKNPPSNSQSAIHKSASNASLDLPAPTSTSSTSISTTNSVRKAASSSSVPTLAADSSGASQIVHSKSAKSSHRAASSSPTPPSDKAATTTTSSSSTTSSRSRSNGNSPVDLTSSSPSSSSSSSGGKPVKMGAPSLPSPSSNQSISSNNSSSNNALVDSSASSFKSSSNGKKKAVDAGSWKGNKSQVRDVDAERSDPDFMRRNSPGLLAVNAVQQQQQQLQQQQMQLQQQQQAQMYGSRPASLLMGMNPEAVNMMYLQQSANSAGFMNMLPSPPHPAAAVPGQPNMYLAQQQMDPGGHLMFSAAPMNHPYSIAGNGSNASSSGEYPTQQAAQSGMLLAPTLPQSVPVFYGQPSPAWPAQPQQGQQSLPAQQQHGLNMVQVVGGNPVYYQPSSGDMQQQHHHQQQYVQQMYQLPQQQAYVGASYYDYSQPTQYYSQQQHNQHALMAQQQSESQHIATSNQQQQQDHDPSPQRSGSGRRSGNGNRAAEPQRLLNSCEFPPLK